MGPRLVQSQKQSPIFFLDPVFWERPFQYLDQYSVKVLGLELNFLREDRSLRKGALLFSCFCLFGWLAMGYDSTIMQLAAPALEIPGLLTGRLTWTDLLGIYQLEYGRNLHWSALVIYGLAYWFLSEYLSGSLGARGSANVCIVSSLVLLQVSVFEWFWILSYWIFQGQAWIVAFRWAQIRILGQNLVFLAVGLSVLGTLQLHHGAFYKLPFSLQGKGYMRALTFLPTLRLRLSRLALVLSLVTLGLMVLWWFYPWPVQTLTVDVQGYGLWSSRQTFPQTLYTVDTDLTDSLAIGSQFYIPDAGVHLLNSLVKIFMAGAMTEIFRLRKDNHEPDKTELSPDPLPLSNDSESMSSRSF